MTLTDLKPGDTVAYYPASYGQQEIYAAKVEKITGKTRITYHVKGKQFDERGRERGRGGWTFAMIAPITPEVATQITAQATVRKLKAELDRLNPDKLTPEQQRELLALLQKISTENPQ